MVPDQGFDDGGLLPKSPTGRVPQWVLDEAAGRPVRTESWRVRSTLPGAGPPRRRRRSRVRRRLSTVVVFGAIVAATLFVDRGALPGSGGVPSGVEAQHPLPGVEAADEPLGAPVDAPVGGGTHAFVASQPDSGRPVAYDPCRPIRYVVRGDNAPAGSDLLLREAFDHVSAITGLRFVAEGPTDEQPSREREPFQPDRYGNRWAPVLVTWETADENPDLLTAAGMAGSAWISRPGVPRVFVTGSVALDAADFDQMLALPGGGEIARAVVLHELGHLVGLAHVDDPTQLMFPTTSTTLDFAAGDLTGLVQLGQGECVPEL